MNEQTTSLDRSAIKVLLLEGVHDQAHTAFVQAGYSNITSLSHALDDESLIEALQSVKIVGVRSRTQLTENILKACPHLIAIGCFCIGIGSSVFERYAQMGSDSAFYCGRYL